MNMNGGDEIRELVKNLLLMKGDRQPFTDQSSLFLSGRLGSVDLVEVVVLLEEKFGIDFNETGFDQEQIDTVDAMFTLIGSAGTRN
jgi:acyl carrier protein